MSNILIIDSDPTTLKLLDRIVLALGHNTHKCLSTEKGWRLLEDGLEVDLAIIDVVMPGMPGVELAQRILSDARLCRMPMIMLSGLVSVNEVDKIISMGETVWFLGKPIHRIDLQNVLDEAFASNNKVK